QRVKELFTARDKANVKIAGIEQKLADAERAKAEELQAAVQQDPRGGYVTDVSLGRPGGPAESTHDVGAIGASAARPRPDLPGRFVRRSDGRPAALERGQRFADHPVVAEAITAQAERDRHVIGMHGGLGSLFRTISTTTGSAVVPQVWAADVIDRARNLAAVTRAGAQIVPMDAKTVQIGRLTADPATGFRAEGSTITASDPTFDQLTLTATTLSCLVIGTLEWFQDVTPGGGADQLVG